jgi:hypothetical protein
LSPATACRLAGAHTQHTHATPSTPSLSQFGGYDETSTGFSLDSIELPATAAATTKPASGSSGVTTEAGSRGGPKLLSQSFNTLLHVAEALTELSIATQVCRRVCVNVFGGGVG